MTNTNEGISATACIMESTDTVSENQAQIQTPDQVRNKVITLNRKRVYESASKKDNGKIKKTVNVEVRKRRTYKKITNEEINAGNTQKIPVKKIFTEQESSSWPEDKPRFNGWGLHGQYIVKPTESRIIDNPEQAQTQPQIDCLQPLPQSNIHVGPIKSKRVKRKPSSLGERLVLLGLNYQDRELWKALEIDISMNEMTILLGKCAATLWDWQKPTSPRYKADFPEKQKNGGSSRWKLHEVIEWMESKK